MRNRFIPSVDFLHKTNSDKSQMAVPAVSNMLETQHISQRDVAKNIREICGYHHRLMKNLFFQQQSGPAFDLEGRFYYLLLRQA